jgi:hypothetical protein
MNVVALEDDVVRMNADAQHDAAFFSDALIPGGEHDKESRGPLRVPSGVSSRSYFCFTTIGTNRSPQ